MSNLKHFLGFSLAAYAANFIWTMSKPLHLSKVLSPLTLSNFHEVRFVEKDIWNGHENGEICLSYYTDKSKVPEPRTQVLDEHRRYDNVKYNGIGYIQYRKNVGQVGLIRLDDEFRGRTLGKQMLDKAIAEMRESGATEVWAVTSKNHPFWSNVYNQSFTWRNPAHSSVTGHGYYMKL